MTLLCHRKLWDGMDSEKAYRISNWRVPLCTVFSSLKVDILSSTVLSSSLHASVCAGSSSPQVVYLPVRLSPHSTFFSAFQCRLSVVPNI